MKPQSTTQEWFKRCIFFDEIDSTNSYALRLLQTSRPEEGTTIVADFQSQGLGQRGNTWVGQAAKNLAMSVILYPDFVPPVQHFDLNLTMALAVYSALWKDVDGLRLKWPNDIYINQHKIGGILMQNSIVGSQIDYTVVGIGLNVNQKEFPLDLPNPSSLLLESGQSMNVRDLALKIIASIYEHYSTLRDGDVDKLRKSYESVLFGRNLAQQFIIDGIQRSGIIKGVQPDGKLIVDLEDETRTFQFGAIKYIWE